MSRIRKYVHSWIDKRHGQARVRHFFRRRGCKQVALPGLPGSPEFESAYQAAIAGAAAPSTIGKRVRAGTLDALAIAYLNSAGFLTLAASTRRVYRNIVERIAAEHGSKPIGALNRQHIEAMLARKSSICGGKQLVDADQDADGLRGARGLVSFRSGA